MSGQTAVITGGSKGLGAAIYLASDAASYTTGAMLSVDGGWSAQ